VLSRCRGSSAGVKAESGNSHGSCDASRGREFLDGDVHSRFPSLNAGGIPGLSAKVWVR
jgi:hypothetical protein